MKYAVNIIHKGDDYACVQQIMTRYILENGLKLDGICEVNQFIDWISKELIAAMNDHNSLYRSEKGLFYLDKNDHQYFKEKKFINNMLMRDLYPFNYNIHTNEGIDDFIQEVEVRCLDFSNEQNKSLVYEVIEDYTIFNHLDLNNPKSRKHFIKWFAESVNDIYKLESAA